MTLFAERPGLPPDDPFDQDAFGPRRRASGRRRLLLGGGAAALLVTLSLTVWYAVGTGARGDGSVPLIQADGRPVKTRPEQPGGMDVPHQDKLVFERLNPSRAGTGKVERLLPGPEEPLPPPEPPAPEPVALPPHPEPVSPAIAIAAEGAVQSPASPPVAPPQASPPASPPAPHPAAAPSAAPAPAGIAPPIAKVEGQAAARPAPPAPPPQAASAQVAALPPSAKGTRLQIASVPNETIAKSELQRLQRRFPAELGGLPATIVRADLGARGVFYRVQVGPLDEAKAAAVCSKLKAQSVGCLPVRP
jgi:hypothetical protein